MIYLSILLGLSLINHPFWDTPIPRKPLYVYLPGTSKENRRLPNFPRDGLRAFALHPDVVTWGQRPWRTSLSQNGANHRPIEDMGISLNRGTPKSSILMGFPLINHQFGSTPIYGNPHMIYLIYSNLIWSIRNWKNLNPWFRILVSKSFQGLPYCETIPSGVRV